MFDKTGVSTVELARRYLPPLVLTQLTVCGLVFWALTEWRDRRNGYKSPAQSLHEDLNLGQINISNAFVPLVPLGLLFASGLPEPYKLCDIPDAWVILPKDGQRDLAYSSRLIGLAMLVGVVVAMVMTPRKARDRIKHFFDGVGYGFANIVSLIVTANCFGVAIREVGLANELGQWIATTPGLMQPLSAFVPLAFAALSGSGMASTQSLFGFFYDPALSLRLDPAAVGAMVSLGSAAGRTLSPVAAVVLMSASLTDTRPVELMKRVAPPLLVGLTTVVVLIICGLL